MLNLNTCTSSANCLPLHLSAVHLFFLSAPFLRDNCLKKQKEKSLHLRPNLAGDVFCVIIGRCRINGETAHFPAAANLWPCKLVIVSDRLPSFGFVASYTPWFFFIMGQLDRIRGNETFCEVAHWTLQASLTTLLMSIGVRLVQRQMYFTHQFILCNTQCHLEDRYYRLSDFTAPQKNMKNHNSMWI